MAKLLQQLRKMRIIKHKANIVFDDTQAFGGAVGRGVEDAGGGGVGHFWFGFVLAGGWVFCVVGSRVLKLARQGGIFLQSAF